MKSPFISKSKYLTGLQCPKLLWYNYNAKDQLPDVSPATQAIFDQGHEVGELAKKLFPDGIDLERGKNFMGILKETQLVLEKRKSIFEAGFLAENSQRTVRTYAQADILNPVENDHWDIIEVKNATKVKDVNYHDLALQRYCYESAGVPINRCCLMHINNKYVRQGELEPSKLFAIADVTEEVNRCSEGLEERVKEMLKVIALSECPEQKIGLYCSDPYDCGLKDLCWNFLPENNVFTLTRLKKEKAIELVESGCLSIGDIPADFKLSDENKIQCECERTGEPHIDIQKLNEFLSTLQFPQYHLDFETFSSAIPMFDNVKPYQQVPFQFSLHIWRDFDTEPEHYSFLAEGRKDSRLEFLESLCKLLGDQGNIVVYNQSFELGRLKDCVELFPEYKDWFENNIKPRVIDLHVPFRSFHYYNLSQKKSTSIKKVLPALCGSSYEGMEIADGGAASREYARVTFSDVDESDRQQVRAALEEYCQLDTQAMIDIVKALTRICTNTQSK